MSHLYRKIANIYHIDLVVRIFILSATQYRIVFQTEKSDDVSNYSAAVLNERSDIHTKNSPTNCCTRTEKTQHNARGHGPFNDRR